MTIKSSQFKQTLIKKNQNARYKYSVYILEAIYKVGMMHPTQTEAVKAANRRAMHDRLEGKKVLKVTKGKAIAIYHSNHDFETMAEAKSYAR